MKALPPNADASLAFAIFGIPLWFVLAMALHHFTGMQESAALLLPILIILTCLEWKVFGYVLFFVGTGGILTEGFELPPLVIVPNIFVSFFIWVWFIGNLHRIKRRLTWNI